ncbi:MAG: hydrogenase expression/formation protein HypE [Actinomycetota bacterium]|nr:hydrogenase expression/formation protein HypE [Actinomycetota bacterium]
MVEPAGPVDPADWSCPVPVGHREQVVLGHGGGGRLSAELLADVFLPALGNPLLGQLADSTVVAVGGERLAMSTDSFVVQPLFFPGGDIGSLAVHGTVNDLACSGAVPLHLTAAFVIEEGTAIEVLRRIAASMGEAARAAGVAIVAGDTKVVQRGQGDGVFITTAGVGRVRDGADVRPERAAAGDAVLLSGSIGRHGVAVMSVRDGLQFGSPVTSDSAPVHGLVAALFDAGVDVHVLRDPTRGGVAASLNEIATAANVGIVIGETEVPVDAAVRSACTLMGLDPLHVANEGRLLVFVAEADAERALAALRATAGGEGAVAIGTVVADHAGMVVGNTAIGGTRIIDMPLGELLPRIC